MLGLFKKTAAFHSVRQISLIALPPLRFLSISAQQADFSCAALSSPVIVTDSILSVAKPFVYSMIIIYKTDIF